ncbi:imidazolonepropionase-like amidohydrolase [Actinopolyspora biskrensis]|uniref:Imidazolonepropionase-like amidohydrolase n=1 Tax=Actinopolyspora biskrensis TaxID=1470178 RepID=A0A852YR22_9ACTN|nr:imidazolonepropionase-like amidohydrolase [Actinopolyspora biskrensis]
MQQVLSAHQLLAGPRGQRFSPGALLIDDDRITAVGTVAEIEERASPDARRLDYPRGTVFPGLVNCHVHLGFDSGEDPVTALRESADDELVAAMGQRARLHLAAGVTTIRDLGDRDGLITELRRSVERGEASGPRIRAACAPLTPPGGHCSFLGGEVSGPERIRARIHDNARRGADVIKVMGNGGQTTPDGPRMTDSQFAPHEFALIVDEAHALGLPVAVHAYTSEVIAATVEAGVDTVEHCTFMAPDGAVDLRDSVAETMAARDIAASPALPSEWRTMWDALGPERSRRIAERLRWLRGHGVPLLFGSDAGVPVSRHGDPVSTLELYEHIGVPPEEILELATTTSARYLGLSAETGALRPGLAADVVVVDGDPLLDLQKLRDPALVLSAGRAFPDGHTSHP